MIAQLPATETARLRVSQKATDFTHYLHAGSMVYPTHPSNTLRIGMTVYTGPLQGQGHGRTVSLAKSEPSKVRHNIAALFENGANNLDLRCVFRQSITYSKYKTRLESK